MCDTPDSNNPNCSSVCQSPHVLQVGLESMPVYSPIRADLFLAVHSTLRLTVKTVSCTAHQGHCGDSGAVQLFCGCAELVVLSPARGWHQTHTILRKRWLREPGKGNMRRRSQKGKRHSKGEMCFFSQRGSFICFCDFLLCLSQCRNHHIVTPIRSQSVNCTSLSGTWLIG